MQLATALRLAALAMQLSNVVKTLVLRATKVPKRTAKTIPTIRARTPHTIPARTAWPGFAAPFVLPLGHRNAAENHRHQTSQQAERKQDEGHCGHEAGHAENQAMPRPLPGRADGGVTSGCADPEYCGCPHDAHLPPASRGAWRGLPGCWPAS